MKLNHSAGLDYENAEYLAVASLLAYGEVDGRQAAAWPIRSAMPRSFAVSDNRL